MTRRDQELLDKQFRWLDRSPANSLLPLSIFTTVLLCVFLAAYRCSTAKKLDIFAGRIHLWPVSAAPVM
jgi:hypothetical protein